jgi:hypothetical protein
MAVMMDNASNNDTMMEAIEDRCRNAGIEFSAKQARMRCMPHTIHLAAIKVSLFLCYHSSFYFSLIGIQLLEGIGLISKENGTRARSAGFNYQDEVNIGLDREEDIEAAPEDEDDHDAVDVNPSEKIQMAVHKVSYLFFDQTYLFIQFS